MRPWLEIAGLALAMATIGGAAFAQATATPVPGKPFIGLGTFDLGALNYQVDEFFLAGEATSYKPAGALGDDGKWKVEPGAKAAFKTRMVVVRPKDPAQFNGTVVVEWLNVSAGGDSAPDWAHLHREMIRNGYAYVAVSAQKVGVDGSGGPGAAPFLKQADAARYGVLNHPGDPYSYDMFTQAGRAVRDGGVLGPLKARRLIAAGESQSAAYMTTYVNAVDPLARTFDGFLIHSRFGPGSKLEGDYVSSVQAVSSTAVRFRPDLRVPVLAFISETDLMFPTVGYLPARQSDTDKLRVWEVAGTAHADNYALFGAAIDSGSAPIEALAKSFTPTDTAFGARMALPMNAAPQHHYVLQAALAALDTWVTKGVAPPHGDRLKITDAAPPELALDEQGNALGGIRSPWMDAPTARFSGMGQSGAGFSRLFGVTEPFDAARIAKLYPGGRADYLAKFETSLDREVKAGFILKADAAEIRALAAAMYPQP